MPNPKRERQRAARQAKRVAAEAARRRAQRRRQVLVVLAGFLAIVAIGFFISRGGGDGDKVAAGAKTGTTISPFSPPRYQAGDAPCPPAGGAEEPTRQFDAPPRKCIKDGVDYQAVIETDVGDVTVDLLEDKAPVAVNNFVFLARYQAYTDIPFHRVIPGFVVQGGDVQNQAGTGGPGYSIPDELPTPEDYGEGSLAMANSGPDTSGSQFFIAVSDDAAKQLVQAVGGSANYTLFGTVTKGMDVVKKIEADGSPGGTPTVEHVIRNVRIIEKKR